MILPMLLKIIKMSFIPFITHSRGFGSSVRLCIQFGSINVIITVIFQKEESFL
jgi:hypothetical protein